MTLASKENIMSFEQAIKEIKAIIKLAGLSGWYTLGKPETNQHDVDIFLADLPSWAHKSFAPGSELDDATKEAVMTLLADDMAHCSSAFKLAMSYLLKIDGLAVMPSPITQPLMRIIHENLMDNLETAQFIIDKAPHIKQTDFLKKAIEQMAEIFKP